MGSRPVPLSALCQVSDSEETDMQPSAMFLIGFALCAASACLGASSLPAMNPS